MHRIRNNVELQVIAGVRGAGLIYEREKVMVDNSIISSKASIFYARDKSMSPKINIGEIALVNTFDRNPVNGMFLVMHNQELKLRHLYAIESHYVLQAENMNYDPIYSKSVAESSTICLLGRVINIIKEP